MKADKRIQEVTKIVEVTEQVTTITLTLTVEEASLLRTSAYAVRRLARDKSAVKQLYSDIYNELLGQVDSVSLTDVQDQLDLPRR